MKLRKLKPGGKAMPEQITRVALAFLLLILGVLGVRAFAVPASHKDTGLQRASTVKRELGRKPKYAGAEACGECHEEERDAKRSGAHADVACETCHGPGAEHVEEPDEKAPEVPKGRSLCVLCHSYNPSRPTGFPQVNAEAHNSAKPCAKCHNPHRPEPPNVPQACSACHQEIARTKAVSHHALLACTTCHQANGEHRKTPRLVRATKPSKRAFCGKCHAKGLAGRDISDLATAEGMTPPDAGSGADAPPSAAQLAEEAPKVDMKKHGNKYECWQCHYPHLPEAL